MLVGELEKALLELIPASAAEPWDRTGMLVGNPLDEVRNVAVALDPNAKALEFAHSYGANVLLTHHPLFLDPPSEVKPSGCTTQAPGVHIWTAVSRGISIISFHTALDANPIASEAMSRHFNTKPTGEILEATPDHDGFGYGRICVSPLTTLGDFAEKCEHVFERRPRIWGNPDADIERVCFWTGAAGEAPAACLERDIDLLVCGEVQYHRALDANELGLCIIELGHDASEQVLCPILVELAEKAGVARDSIYLMPLPENWR